MNDATGYRSAEYAEALAESGTPVQLEASGGWLLERTVPGATATDAASPYPLLSLARWNSLGQDLKGLPTRLVSVVAVCDPFGTYTQADLESAFDFVRPFKTHVVVDLKRFSPSRHHLRQARTALRRVAIDEVADRLAFVPDWCQLYAHLIQRHNLAGTHVFSERSIREQFAVPGMRIFRATLQGRLVAAHCWVTCGDVTYSHLLAVSPEGYASSASYALYTSCLDRLRDVATWADLGGAAGVEDRDDALFAFKSGWSTGRRYAWLGGKILDAERYRTLSCGLVSDFFPVYRTPVEHPSPRRVSI